MLFLATTATLPYKVRRRVRARGIFLAPLSPSVGHNDDGKNSGKQTHLTRLCEA